MEGTKEKNMNMILARQLKKKNGKKGFTLVEVIVVLVIIAILAAIAIPAMTGYIKRANDKALISDGRTILVALQTTASEKGITSASNAADKAELSLTAVNELSGTSFAGTLADVTVDGNGAITGFKYTDGKTVVYDSAEDEKFTVANDAP